MFEKVKRIFGRRFSGRSNAPEPTVAWERPNTAMTPPARQAASQPPPSLPSSRAQEPTGPSRERANATMTPPSTESVMAARRQQTAAAAPPPARQESVDTRRVVKSFNRGERTNAKEFLNIATQGGERDLRRARAREVRLRTRQGMEDGMTLLHRSGSTTELKLANNDAQVAAAKHHSKSTGQTFEVREREMRGPAKRQLDKIVRRNIRHTR